MVKEVVVRGYYATDSLPINFYFTIREIILPYLVGRKNVRKNRKAEKSKRPDAWVPIFHCENMHTPTHTNPKARRQGVTLGARH